MARRRVHPLTSAATMLPLALALTGNVTTSRTSQPRTLRGGRFALQCTLPFDDIKEHHPIDDSCTADGRGAAGSPQAAQNDAKNNFCATGTPVDIDFNTLHQLQKAAEDKGISFGSDSQLPDDRKQLRNFQTDAGRLGEGAVVRLAAYILDAHYSNVGVGKGESVNCKQPDKDSNDIHIVLEQDDKDKDQCDSVTAEMSPHYRPESWNPSDLNDRNAHMYRFTGQLFFDASHRPCSGGKGSPKRSSIWEIHPVYGLEICIAADGKCDPKNDQNWQSFAEFAGVEPSETRLLLQDDIARHFGRGGKARRN